MPLTLDKAGVHHTGGTAVNPRASTQHLTLQHIESAHMARWPDFKSALGYHVGYSELIFSDGSFVQTRLLGEETAAVIGSNKRGFYPCLIGNFTKGVDTPTKAQEDTLAKHLKACLTNNVKEIEKVGLKVAQGTVLKFSLAEVKPHRILHLNHTECYGMALADDWARKLAVTETVKVEKPNGYTEEEQRISYLNQIFLYYFKLYDFLPKKRVVGAFGERECEGFINL